MKHATLLFCAGAVVSAKGADQEQRIAVASKAGKSEGRWKTVEGLPALDGAALVGTCADRLVAGVLVAPKE